MSFVACLTERRTYKIISQINILHKKNKTSISNSSRERKWLFPLNVTDKLKFRQTKILMFRVYLLLKIQNTEK